MVIFYLKRYDKGGVKKRGNNGEEEIKKT